MARKPIPSDDGATPRGFEAVDLYPSANEVPEESAPAAPQEGSTPRKPRTAIKGTEKPAEAPPRNGWGEGRSRNTRSFSITDDVFDRMRRYAHTKGVSMSELAEVAFTRAMDRAEEANGGPFPPVPTVRRGTLDDL